MINENVIIAVGITILTLIINIWNKMKIRRYERIIYKRFIVECGIDRKKYQALLYTSYKDSNFAEVDMLLQTDNRNPIVIIFDAPEWLFHMKSRNWSNHKLISSKSCSLSRDLLHNKILIFKKDKNVIINESTEYIRLMSLEPNNSFIK